MLYTQQHIGRTSPILTVRCILGGRGVAGQGGRIFLAQVLYQLLRDALLTYGVTDYRGNRETQLMPTGSKRAPNWNGDHIITMRGPQVVLDGCPLKLDF